MVLPEFSDDLSAGEKERFFERAIRASDFLRALGQESRLIILCALTQGEKSVTELEQLLSARKAAVSQQLARLRLQGLVKARRDGKNIYYSLTDDRPRQIIEVVYEMFCRDDAADT
ncbi:MAG: metalloregulator ArsR/SmtB family transcription factor [Pseudomonadota bacterium]